jgi:hypothetical protein
MKSKDSLEKIIKGFKDDAGESLCEAFTGN